MAIDFPRLVAARDVIQFHRHLRTLECACDQLESVLQSATPSSARPIEQLTYAYLAGYRSFCKGTMPEFEQAMQPFRSPRQPVSAVERYLVARGHALIAMHYCRMGRVADATKHATQATAVGNTLNFGPLRAEAILVDSQIKTVACDWLQAAERAGAALHLLQDADAKDLLGEADAWLALGQAYFGRGEFPAAKRYIETALNLYMQCMDSHGQAQAQLLLAHLHYHAGDYARHDRVLDQVEPLCEGFGYRRELGTVQRYRGKRELERGNWQRAVDYFLDGLKIVESLEDPSASARLHLSMARAYAAGGNMDKAKGEYKTAQDDFDKAGDRTRSTSAKVTKALLLAQSEPTKSDEVEEMFKAAVKTFSELGDRRHLATALYEMGMQYRRWKDYGAAAKCLAEAVTCASTMHAERLIERYRADETLSEAEKQWSELLSKATGQQQHTESLIAYIYHELANIVGPVKGNVELLLSMNTLPKMRDIAKKLQAAAEHMRHLTAGLPAYARLEALKPQQVDLKLTDAVNEAISILWPFGGGKKLTVRNEIRDEVLVRADPPTMLRVLVNLLSNTRKFTPKGLISVASSRLEAENLIQVTLRDTSFGMDKAARTEWGDLGWQAARWVALGPVLSAECGFTTGLVFCKVAVEAHGGRIWVDLDKTRKKGEDKKRPKYHGTVIHFTLPAAKAKAGATDRPSA